MHAPESKDDTFGGIKITDNFSKKNSTNNFGSIQFTNKEMSNPVKSPLLRNIKRPQVEPEDYFKKDLSLESIFSKFAIGCFAVFLVTLGSVETKTFTMVAFFGFLMFSLFYGFLRFRNA
ncbi:hypothetical protein KKE92_00675 [Candidatus Micrarchaeota archaeon]|nr:hypothetical protein [Candidatus Micrarchaeota archaeon]